MEPVKMVYPVEGGDFIEAGEASSKMKMILKKLGLPSDVIRKAAICMYEGEINMVIHANGGRAEVEVTLDQIVLRMIDEGPGIPDVAKAMEEGAANTKIPAEKAKMIAENKVKGRMNNFFAEVCLLNQAYVKENKVTVGDHVKAVAKSLGGTIVVKAFTRFETGEGIEKQEEDYAAEVASLAGMTK